MSDEWNDFIAGARFAAADAARLAEEGPPAVRELLTIDTGSYAVETLFIPARAPAPGPKKLVVFMSAGGRAARERAEDVRVLFNRWTWHRIFPDRDALCVEDPMYKLYPGLRTGWYYGRPDAPLLDELHGALEAFRAALGAERKDVLFVGSSAGGYAALYLCDRMKGSSCVAMNPQLIPANCRMFAGLAAALGLDPAAEDPFGRNDITRVAANRESKFVISCALRSKNDFDRQVKPLLDAAAGSVPRPGGEPEVVMTGNFVFLLAGGTYPEPHGLLLDPADVAALAGFMEADAADPGCYALVLRHCEKRWAAEQEARYKKFWLKTLRSARLKNCGLPVIGLKKCVVPSADGAFAAEIAYRRRPGRAVVRLSCRGAVSPRAAADFLRGLPKIRDFCEIAAREDHVRIATDGGNLAAALGAVGRIFEISDMTGR